MNTNLKILLVEDDNDAMTLTRHYLKEIGYHDILEAEDAIAALNLLTKVTVDLIISDRYMPIMDGIEFYQALQASEELKNIPFLMTTSENQKDKITDAMLAGIKNYIIKPVDAHNLAMKINRIFKPA